MPTRKADWGVSPDEGGKVAMTNEEQNRWRVWRAQRDAFQPAANSGAGQKHAEPFVDRPLLRAVEYVEKEAAGKQ